MSECDSWARALKTAQDAIDEVAPSRALIENPNVLKSKELQETLLDNKNKSELSRRIEKLGEMIRIWKQVQVAGAPLSEIAVKAASKVKTHGKTCVGMEWVVRKLTLETPNDPSAVQEFVTGLKSKLKAKGIVIPGYMQKALGKVARVEGAPEREDSLA